MNIIAATILFTCYFFAAARAYVTCGVAEWAGTSCVELEQCPHFLRPLKQLHQTDGIEHRSLIVNRTRPATCGFNRNSPMVCCPNKPSQSEPTKPTIEPINCGNFIKKNLLSPDGMQTDLNVFPWLALLEYDTGCGRKFRCGGVLISDRHVLTSAQCLNRAGGKLVSVRLGEHDLRTARDCLDDPDSKHCTAKPIDAGIERQMLHESYTFLRGPSDFDEFIYDVAVLKLNRSVITDVVRPICLPNPTEISNPVADGKFLWGGWGFAQNAAYPQSLVKVMSRLKQISTAKCRSFYPFYVKEDHICALPESRKDACIADSGGPLMGFNNDGRITVMGIYAPVNSQSCQKEAVPSMFVDVKKYVDWIRLQMQY